MKTNIQKKKSFVFSIDDYQTVNLIITNAYDKVTIGSVLRGLKYNTDYFLHLMRAYEKIARGAICGGVHFEPDEKSVICDMLRKAYHSDKYDDVFREKVRVILEAVFHQDDFTEGE